MSSRTRATLILIALTYLSSSRGDAANCAGTSIGVTPLDDLGPGLYLGEEGGLYPGGSNAVPPAHAAMGLERAADIAPIDGRIVLISIGMSNTTQEFSTFVPLAMSHPDRNPALQVIDTAQGGVDACRMSNPDDVYWTNVISRLDQQGAGPEHVRAAWVKQAVAGPSESFQVEALMLRDKLEAIVHILHDMFPNLELVFFSSRIYAGYADTPLNPETWAYETGFAVKWLIEDQITGDPALNPDPDAGPVTAPWLAWGPYLWADGLVPRSDGLIWTCDDFGNDGTHPSGSGRAKVADMLLDFFTTSPFATPWFLNGSTTGLPGAEAGSAAHLAVPSPNPFRTETVITFSLDRAGNVALDVFDAAGALVRRLEHGLRVAGRHDVRWDACDDARRRVAPGVYFVRLLEGSDAATVQRVNVVY